jgi:hypothetical protein
VSDDAAALVSDEELLLLLLLSLPQPATTKAPTTSAIKREVSFDFIGPPIVVRAAWSAARFAAGSYAVPAPMVRRSQAPQCSSPGA